MEKSLMMEIDEKYIPARKRGKFNVKRMVSVVCSTLIGFLAFMFIWCGAGVTMNNFSPTLHPGWWMALGYAAGSIGMVLFEIVSKKIQVMIEH